MVVLVFTVGTVNILLGYALAYYLRCVLDQADDIAALAATPIVEQEVVEEPPPQLEPEEEVNWEDDAELAEIEVTETIPADWVDQLKRESIEAKSLVEAMAQVMCLEINKYREAVVRLEDEMRQEGVNAAKLKSIIGRLIKVNRQWLAVQVDASSHLNQRIDSLGQYDDIGNWIDKVLLDQQSQIESTCNNLANLDTAADMTEASNSLVNEFARLVNLAHQLRDGVGNALFTVLRADDRMDTLPDCMRDDLETGFRSRGGFEFEVNEWIKADPGRQRLASAALVDVCQVGPLNRQYGTRAIDRLLVATASLLNEVLRKNRGFEVVARTNGQQYLLFFGDTGPRGATSAAERIRQSFADALFEYGQHDFEVTVSCAVTEFTSSDNAGTLFDHLQETLLAAKQSGGNCTTLDEGDGPTPIAPPDYQLPDRVITVE